MRALLCLLLLAGCATVPRRAPAPDLGGGAGFTRLPPLQLEVFGQVVGTCRPGAACRVASLAATGAVTGASATFTGTATANRFTSSAASGSNGFSVTTNGARYDIGTGANDHFYGDGVGIITPGNFTASGTIGTLQLGTNQNVVAGLNSIFNLSGQGVFKVSNSGVAISSSAPTISSGFGTSPSIASSNGTFRFTINVGTGGVATSGVIGLPTATAGWTCRCDDLTTQSATVFVTKQTASSTTSCTVGNFDAAGAAAAWVASDVLACSAHGG